MKKSLFVLIVIWQCNNETDLILSATTFVDDYSYNIIMYMNRIDVYTEILKCVFM